MKDSNLNLNGLTFLVADPSSYFCTVIHGILRSFGASKVLETRDARGVVQNLTEHRIDILLLDANVPPMGGLKLTKTIRRNEASEYRTVPILILTSDTRATTLSIGSMRKSTDGRKLLYLPSLFSSIVWPPMIVLKSLSLSHLM